MADPVVRDRCRHIWQAGRRLLKGVKSSLQVKSEPRFRQLAQDFFRPRWFPNRIDGLSGYSNTDIARGFAVRYCKGVFHYVFRTPASRIRQCNNVDWHDSPSQSAVCPVG